MVIFFFNLTFGLSFVYIIKLAFHQNISNNDSFPFNNGLPAGFFMRNKLPQKLHLALLLISCLLIIILLALFVKVPYYIKGPCRLLPEQNWSLIQIEPDKIIARLECNSPHKISEYKLLQFDRPDFVSFKIAHSLRPGHIMKQGELIGHITSTENQFKLGELMSQLYQARDEFEVILSGEKLPIQKEAEVQLNYAETAYRLFRPIAERKRQLYADSLISQEEWEQAETKLKLLKLDISVAKARFESVRTGQKEEMVQLMKTKIQSLEKQVADMKSKISAEAISTPIAGMMLDSYEPGTICSIAKVDTMIVQIPIEEKNRRYAKKGLPFRLKISSMGTEIFSGELESVGNNAHMVTGRMMFILIGVIENPERNIMPGSTGYVKIYCGNYPVWKYFRTWWLSFKFI